MTKITDVYMNIDGEQKHLTMRQFIELREMDPSIKSLKFIPIDNSMYQATPEQFKAWRCEQNRRAYLGKQKTVYSKVPKATHSQDFPVDYSVNVEEEVVRLCLQEAVRKAFPQLNAEEQALINAVILHGISEREYAKKIGISQPAVHKRVVRILSQLKTNLKN